MWEFTSSAPGLASLGSPFGSQAQHVHLVLHIGIRKVHLLQREGSLQSSFWVTLSLPGRMCSLVFMASTPVITTGCVLTASCRKSCMRPAGTSTSRSMVCPLPFHIHHCALAGKLRRTQLRVHRLKIGVAGRSVDDGRKLRVQGHGVIRGIEGKIRHIRGSLYFDPVEPAGEVSDGMQNAADPLDGVQVSMLKGVLAGHGRDSPGVSVFHGPKVPTA